MNFSDLLTCAYPKLVTCAVESYEKSYSKLLTCDVEFGEIVTSFLPSNNLIYST